MEERCDVRLDNVHGEGAQRTAGLVQFIVIAMKHAVLRACPDSYVQL